MIEIYISFLTSLLIFFCVSTNTMYAVFSFIAYALLLFICFFFFKIEFLTYLFFIIYMGAIIVLFLFVIMLIEFKPIKLDTIQQICLKIALVFFCFYSFLIGIKNEHINTNLNFLTQNLNYKYKSDVNIFLDYIDIIEIGLIFYDCFGILIINITMLFLLGIISVVLLTKTNEMKKRSFRLTK